VNRPDTGALLRSRLLRSVWRAAEWPGLWAVGGAVRDRLLGLPWRDLDLAASGTLEETHELALRLAALLGGRPHALGNAPRAVWRIDGGRMKVEIWPLGNLTPEQDALRRDYTVNAIAWRLPDGPFVDPSGGLGDLASRRLVAVSRANLEEDPVRLLRAPRLAASLPGFRIERRTLAWIRGARALLRKAPRERVGVELTALLDGPAAPRAWQLALSAGLLREAAPGPVRTGRFRNGAAALERLARPEAHPIPGALRTGARAARLGLLLRAWGGTDRRSLGAYAWERPVLTAALRAAEFADAAVRAVHARPRDRRRLIHEAGEATPAVLALAAALDAGDPGPWWRFWRLWRRRGPELTAPRPLLSAAHIGRLLGLEPGPELGAAIRNLLEAQIDGRVRNRAEARRFLLGLS